MGTIAIFSVPRRTSSPLSIRGMLGTDEQRKPPSLKHVTPRPYVNHLDNEQRESSPYKMNDTHHNNLYNSYYSHLHNSYAPWNQSVCRVDEQGAT